MSHIDFLSNLQNDIENGQQLDAAQKMYLIDKIDKERNRILSKEDPFKYFYIDVTLLEDVFDFKSVLGESYITAQGHAGCCVDIFVSFPNLTPTIELQNWLSSAIRVVNCIVTHYLQEVLNVEAEKQDDYGMERSRYKQVERLNVKASKAGRIMFNLYGERNNMEHQVKTDPNDETKKMLVPPKYKRTLRQINRRLPEALINFNEAYKEHYS